MRIAPWICAALVTYGVYRWYAHRELAHAPGVVAAEEPAQDELASVDGLERDGFRLVPRADFSATVRILHREDYSMGPLAKLVPTDFAVGWGRMSDSAVLASIEISQANRFYFWRTQDWPIERGEIEAHSANWHVIPENDTVRAVLGRLRTGSVVELRGRLVDIEAREGGMSTSLSRTDTGPGACEILLATSARVLESG